MNKSAGLVALFLCGQLLANPADFPDDKKIQAVRPQVFPSTRQIEATQKEIRPTNERDLKQNGLMPQAISDLQATARVPDLNIETPAPDQVRSSIDISKWLDQYQKSASTAAKQEAVLLFLSSSIPEKTVKELLQQARDRQVTVVFRGAVGENPLSLNSLRDYLLSFKLGTYPEVQINPVAFKQFSISEVPAVVVAQPVGDAVISETGCAPQSLFAVVYGDIPVDYALERIHEKADPAIAEIARRHFKKEW